MTRYCRVLPAKNIDAILKKEEKKNSFLCFEFFILFNEFYIICVWCEQYFSKCDIFYIVFKNYLENFIAIINSNKIIYSHLFYSLQMLYIFVCNV